MKLNHNGLHVGALLLTVVVSVFVYLNTLSADFVHDDVNQVLNNPWITDVRYIPDLFFSNAWAFEGTVSNFYRPLAFLAYTACYYVFGLEPWGFHLVNIVLHAIVSVLVYLLASSAFQRANPELSLSTQQMLALASALIFAAHPIHVEAVAWVSGIMDLLCAMFFLLSFYLYSNEQPGWNRYKVFSLASFFLAALSKETALTLPIMLLTYDLFVNRNVQLSFSGLRQLVARYLPYVCVVIAYLLLRIYALGGFAPRHNSLDLSAYVSFINVFPLFAHYLEKLVLPIGLNVYHGLDPITSLASLSGLLSIAIFLVYGLFLWWLRGHYRMGVFYLIWIVIPLLPVFYLPALGGNPFSERYLYLPSVGFVMLAIMGVHYVSGRIAVKYGSRSVWFAGMVLTVFGFYATATIGRNEVWANNITLWEDAARKSPDEFPVYINLASAYFEEKRYNEALTAVQQAVRLNPRSGEALYGLGSIYFSLDRMPEAIDALKLALSADPSNPVKHYHLGAAYAKNDMPEQAIRQFRQSIALNPDYAVAYFQLGLLYAEQDKWKKAAPEFEQAVRIEPSYSEAWRELGLVYERQSNFEAALRAFLLVTGSEGATALDYVNLGRIYLRMNMSKEARIAIEKALDLKPGYDVAMEVLHAIETGSFVE